MEFGVNNQNIFSNDVLNVKNNFKAADNEK
jgi:hypothetical protein